LACVSRPTAELSHREDIDLQLEPCRGGDAVTSASDLSGRTGRPGRSGSEWISASPSRLHPNPRWGGSRPAVPIEGAGGDLPFRTRHRRATQLFELLTALEPCRAVNRLYRFTVEQRNVKTLACGLRE